MKKMKHAKPVLAVVVLTILSLSNYINAQEKKPSPYSGEDNLFLEEMMIHYDKLFSSYLETAGKDTEEFNRMMLPLKEKSYARQEVPSNQQLIESLYLKSILDHLILLEHLLEILHSKLGVAWLIAQPEEKPILKSLQQKYESREEYDKLLRKIETLEREIRNNKEMRKAR